MIIGGERYADDGSPPQVSHMPDMLQVLESLFDTYTSVSYSLGR